MKKLLIGLFLFLITSLAFAQPRTISGGWYILENKTKGKVLWISDSLILNALIKSTTDSVIILDNLSVRGKIRANQYQENHPNISHHYRAP